jgi:hypothetical protein
MFGGKMKKLLLTMITFGISAHALAENKQYNFLFVVENEDTVADQRQILKSNFGQFLTNLNSRGLVQFNLGITTTDYFSYQGAMTQSASGVSRVTSQSTSPVQDFGAIMDNIQNTATSFWEQGLAQANAAIQNNPSDFAQPGVPLVIIVVSDDDDWSCKGQCYGVEPENNSTYIEFPVVDYIHNFHLLQEQKNVAVSTFPLVGILDNDCALQHRGSRYLEVQMALGFGVKGSICATKIANDFLNIATIIANQP